MDEINIITTAEGFDIVDRINGKKVGYIKDNVAFGYKVDLRGRKGAVVRIMGPHPSIETLAAEVAYFAGL